MVKQHHHIPRKRGRGSSTSQQDPLPKKGGPQEEESSTTHKSTAQKEDGKQHLSTRPTSKEESCLDLLALELSLSLTFAVVTLVSGAAYPSFLWVVMCLLLLCPCRCSLLWEVLFRWLARGSSSELTSSEGQGHREVWALTPSDRWFCGSCSFDCWCLVSCCLGRFALSLSFCHMRWSPSSGWCCFPSWFSCVVLCFASSSFGEELLSPSLAVLLWVVLVWCCFHLVCGTPFSSLLLGVAALSSCFF